MKYRQITSDERYMISAFRKQGICNAEIARQIGRSPSTIGREIKRNRCNDGDYRPSKAASRTRSRRRESRRHWQFSDGHLGIINVLLREDWSPEQISGWLRVWQVFRISHQSIYRYVWYDRFYGGSLYKHLRQAGKRWRKLYRSHDSRGVLPGKRHISERSMGAENRSRFGHWEGDTVMGDIKDQHCIVTLVERKSRFTEIGKLKARSTAELNNRLQLLIRRQQRKVHSLTTDNGTEFHDFRTIEAKTGALFYFSSAYCSWQRGLNENTNGLIRQYLPKTKSMAQLTQAQCDAIATRLNRRPRKLLGFKTPEQVYVNYCR